MEMLIAKIQSELLEVVNKFTLKNVCNYNYNVKKATFLMSKAKKKITDPHFYII